MSVKFLVANVPRALWRSVRAALAASVLIVALFFAGAPSFVQIFAGLLFASYVGGAEALASAERPISNSAARIAVDVWWATLLFAIIVLQALRYSRSL